MNKEDVTFTAIGMFVFGLAAAVVGIFGVIRLYGHVFESMPFFVVATFGIALCALSVNLFFIERKIQKNTQCIDSGILHCVECVHGSSSTEFTKLRMFKCHKGHIPEFHNDDIGFGWRPIIKCEDFELVAE